MKAIRCREWGAPDVLRLEEAESPSLERHQVRIRIRACGPEFRRHADGRRPVSGQAALPLHPRHRDRRRDRRDRWHYSPRLSSRNARRSPTCAPPEGSPRSWWSATPLVVPIPDAMDFVTAAAFPVAYGTSHFALTHRGHLQAGETLLVLGAAGGVGLTAVEIGKHLGARVIAAAGGAEKCAVTREYGADEVIDYRRENIRDRVRALTGGAGVDVVYDPVGGDAFDQALRAVNWEARMLIVGFASGRVPSTPSQPRAGQERLDHRCRLGRPIRARPGLHRRQPAELLRWWEAGRLKPLIAKVFPLPEAGEALTALLSRRYAGKIVLET